jgi:long-chain acyl-CoA synthetase
VGAAVQLKAGEALTEAELIAYAAGRLPAFKVPVRIDVRLDEFPRNASGKTLKARVREELLAKLQIQ